MIELNGKWLCYQIRLIWVWVWTMVYALFLLIMLLIGMLYSSLSPISADLGKSKFLIGEISFYRFIYVYLIFLNLRKFWDFCFIVDKDVIEMWLRSCNCIQCNVWDRHMACSWIWKDNVHHSPKSRTIAHENAEEIWLVHSPLSQDKTTELALMSIMLY